jgi:WD40-like Beta Propeller Repeat
MRLAVGLTVLCVVMVAWAPASSASTIVYAKAGDVWLMNPDGSGQHQVTHSGSYSEPTQADDGTILALTSAGDVVRLDQYGKQLSPPVATAVTGASASGGPYSSWVDLKGPFDPVISPDGTTFAYWGGGTVYTYNVACNCQEFESKSFVRYGGPSSFSEPGSQGVGQEDYAYPSFIDNHTLLMSQVGVDSLIADVAVYTLGPGGNNETLWFSDSAANSTGMLDGVESRQGDKLAFVVGITPSGGQPTEQLRIYTTNGPPATNANAPTARCGYMGPTGGQFAYPSFSPDGQYLAWAEGDGIHVGKLGDMTTCAGFTDTLVAPGGNHPSWGPADLKPPPPPPPPPPKPCSGLTGAKLQNCQAKQAYDKAIARCDSKYGGTSKSAKANDSACRKKAKTAYHRALALTKCKAIKNKHKRAVCVQHAKRKS